MAERQKKLVAEHLHGDQKELNLFAFHTVRCSIQSAHTRTLHFEHTFCCLFAHAFFIFLSAFPAPLNSDTKFNVPFFTFWYIQKSNWYSSPSPCPRNGVFVFSSFFLHTLPISDYQLNSLKWRNVVGLFLFFSRVDLKLLNNNFTYLEWAILTDGHKYVERCATTIAANTTYIHLMESYKYCIA